MPDNCKPETPAPPFVHELLLDVHACRPVIKKKGKLKTVGNKITLPWLHLILRQPPQKNLKIVF